TNWERAVSVGTDSPDIKLFGKWSNHDVQINDVSLQDYTAVKKYAKHRPHSAGQYAAKPFPKAQGPIVECLTHSMMTQGRNNCKKLLTLCIAKHAFETIHLLTQVLVNAIINSGPQEDSTCIGGAEPGEAVDVSPLCCVNSAIWPLCTGTHEA
uniref:Small ribosomal subunit protein uS7 domain-containing protein n=1 Tax=Chlorocebus sabaeus TaxID=60711 RepID=A0A0D9RSC8_CHLSB